MSGATATRRARSTSSPTRPATGCRVLVIAEPTRAFSQPEIAAVETFVDGGGRLLVMVGPVFAPGGAAFAHLGLEALAARYGVALDDDLVVDPSHASDVEGPSVWAAGRDSYLPHPITARLGGRLTFWPRTRQVAPLEPASAGADGHAARPHQRRRAGARPICRPSAATPI